MKKVSKGEGGFTLIELLIVIIILGILAAVVAFNVGGFLGAGTEETAKTQLSTLQTAVIASMADYSRSTVTGQTIGTSGSSITKPDTITLFTDPVDGAINMSVYLQSDIQGQWTFGNDGVFTSGNFTGGGTTCTYTRGGTPKEWVCP